MEKEIEQICPKNLEFVRSNLDQWRSFQPESSTIRVFCYSSVTPGMMQRQLDNKIMRLLSVNPRLSTALATGWKQKFSEALESGRSESCLAPFLLTNTLLMKVSS
jgi:hypothetical protein